MLFFANVLSLIPEDTINLLYVVCLVLLQIFIGGVQQQKIECEIFLWWLYMHLV